MAWQDFIKAIRRDEDEEKKRGSGFWDRTLGAVDDTLDAASWGVERGKDVVGAAAGFGREAFVKPLVSAGLSLAERSERNATTAITDTADELKKLSYEDRKKAIQENEGLKLVLENRGITDPTDENLDKTAREEKEKGKKNDKGFTPAGGFQKALFGNEPIQSYQARREGLDKALTEKTGALGTPLAVAATGANMALDLPGISAIKTIGRQGLKQLAAEGTDEGVRAILKSRLPSLADEQLNDLAPRIAQLTDEGAIRQTLQEVGKRITSPLQNPRDLAASAVDTAKDIGAKVPTPSRKPGNYGEAADKLLGNLKHGSELEDLSKPGFRQSFREQFVDKLSPVNDMVKTIEQKTGRKLSTEDNPYELMRLYQGMPDRVQQRVSGLTDVLKQAPDLDAVKVIGMGRQMIDRAGRGIGSSLSPEDARSAIQGVYQKLGAEDFDKAAAVADAVTEYNRGLLDDLHGAGIISDDALKAINDVGAHYFSKFNVVDYIMKNDQNRALFSSSGSYNTTKQSLNKILSTAKGMEEGTELLDPIESVVRATDQTMRAIAKNDIWHSFDRLADEVPELVVRTRDPDNVLKRIDLSLENKELRPVRNKLDRMISTRGQWVRKLESQINQLEKKGLNLSLKKGGERMTDQPFEVAGLGGRVPTAQTGKTGMVDGFLDVINPSKLGPQDTGRFVRSLIEKGSRSDIDKIKRMVDTRDTNMVSLLDELGEMKSQYDDVAGKVRGNVGEIRKLADDEAPEGMALISGFGKGVEGKLAVPKEIADVFTGKNKAQQDYLTSAMGKVNQFVKQNFTSNNPAFALITNPFRDAKTFAYNAKDVRSNPASIGMALAKGLWHRSFGKGELYDRWVAAGGKSGFYADERTGETIAKDVAREVRNNRKLGVRIGEVNNTKDFLRETARVLSAPLRAGRDALHGAASILEDTPRMAQFQASLKAGKSDIGAAFNARDVTVDFQQSGRIGQTVNAWIPFLNARFQGTLKSVDAVKRNPARAAAVYAGLTATPIIAAALNNNQFPEVLKMIPDQDRDNNFIIVLGDAKDEKGRFSQVIKIPKSDIDKVLGNPLEQMARWAANDSPDTLAEVLTNMIGGLSPVDLVRDDKLSLERSVGGILPPIAKAPLEAVTNRNLYFGSDIVPESMQDLPKSDQVRKDDPNTPIKERETSKVAQFLASLTGASPIKTENTVRGFTGSLLTEKPQDQLGGKLSGVSANQMNNEFYKTLDDTSKKKAQASRFINEAIARGDYAVAQETAQNYNEYLKKKFTPLNERYADQITPELYEVYSKQKITLTPRSIKQRQRNQLERTAAQ